MFCFKVLTLGGSDHEKKGGFAKRTPIKGGKAHFWERGPLRRGKKRGGLWVREVVKDVRWAGRRGKGGNSGVGVGVETYAITKKKKESIQDSLTTGGLSAGKVRSENKAIPGVGTQGGALGGKKRKRGEMGGHHLGNRTKSEMGGNCILRLRWGSACAFLRGEDRVGKRRKGVRSPQQSEGEWLPGTTAY